MKRIDQTRAAVGGTRGLYGPNAQGLSEFRGQILRLSMPRSISSFAPCSGDKSWRGLVTKILGDCLGYVRFDLVFPSRNFFGESGPREALTLESPAAGILRGPSGGHECYYWFLLVFYFPQLIPRNMFPHRFECMTARNSCPVFLVF